MAEQLVEISGPDEFNLLAEKQCNFCRNVSSSCKTCLKCRSVRYCGKKDCKDRAWAGHKAHCKRIEKLKNRMDTEKRKLNLSGDDVGIYWGLGEPRNFCRLKNALGQAMLESGKEENNLFAFKMALEQHFMELLRLNHSDNQGIRSDAAFVLLFTRQYQKCYDLIAWFVIVAGRSDYDWEAPPGIRKGQWKYLEGEDILGQLPLNDLENDHLLCLILLKMIIIRDLRDGKEFPSFSRAIQDLDNQQEIEALRQNEIDRQEGILKCYMNLMDQQNPFILKAIVNPEPMRTIGSPMYISRGSFGEARAMVDYDFYFKHFGMVERLAQRFEGQSLEYEVPNHNPDN